MTDLIRQITDDIQKQIDTYQPELNLSDVGTVVDAGDGIARVRGLEDVKSQELVQFANGVMGIAFNLEKDNVGVIIMGEYAAIGKECLYALLEELPVPVGDGMVGKWSMPWNPNRCKGAIKSTNFRPIERIAPGVVQRKDVDTPVQTGLKAIDLMIPLGRGQRELIMEIARRENRFSDRYNYQPKRKDLFCIYVAIGQKKSAIARTVATLERYGQWNTTVVVASADEPVALQYIAPYSGAAMGEEFMETGRDALVIYDDLSKHAWAYRQVSLLLRRPPGRGTRRCILFHSRLLEGLPGWQMVCDYAPLTMKTQKTPLN
jgi:F-type H+-transporting ATPase subunit alpha